MAIPMGSSLGSARRVVMAEGGAAFCEGCSVQINAKGVKDEIQRQVFGDKPSRDAVGFSNSSVCVDVAAQFRFGADPNDRHAAIVE